MTVAQGIFIIGGIGNLVKLQAIDIFMVLAILPISERITLRIFNNRGSLNLELAIIIAILILVAAGTLIFMANGISDRFQVAGEQLNEFVGSISGNDAGDGTSVLSWSGKDSISPYNIYYNRNEDYNDAILLGTTEETTFVIEQDFLGSAYYYVEDATGLKTKLIELGPNYVTNGLVLDLESALAAGTSPGVNFPPTTTWVDATGNNSAIPLGGSPDFTEDDGWVGDNTPNNPYRLRFKGTYVYANGIVGFNNTQATVESYFYTESLNTEGSSADLFGDDYGGRGHVFIRSYGGATPRLQIISQNPDTSYGPSYVLNNPPPGWYHVVIGWDESEDVFRIWVNGVRVRDTSMGTWRCLDQRVRIGNTSSIFSSDQVYFRVYNRLLSEEEIQRNYNSRQTW